ncbi:fibronectin type III domain-containing protein [uncultured Prevotella sp.]|uniref:fibronectin type III domain-containing protein n=1 Tax=uncultured Prevotella sp. TaxID=159272 RepID=UPI0027E22796|nr:fibronectin type III domain-containing protein [uncultured Prevotella sp.]
MKKIFSIMLGLAMAMGVNAQTENPNRLIMMSQAGNKAYALDKIDSIYFAKKEGQVRADVKFLKYVKDDKKGDILHVAVTRTDPNCSYCIDVLPANTAKRYSDDVLAQYFDQQKTTKFYKDFTDAELTGFKQELEPNTKYTVFTVAYDEYGVACEASRADFTTPKTPLIGNPAISYTIDETTTSSITLTVTANEDCFGYYWCLFDKGQAQAQFEQWGPMFGFQNIESMIAQFSGKKYEKVTTYTWKDLKPGTEYDICVVPVDEAGTYADMVTIPVTTKQQGGEGVAQVAITSGGAEVYEGKLLYTIIFTPNDQTAVYHDLVVSKEAFDKDGEEFWKNYLLNGNPEDPNYNQYGVDKFPFEAEAGKQYYGIAIAKNANGEYGPMVKELFKVEAPAGVAPAKVKANKGGVATRIKTNEKRTAVVPVMKSVKLVSAE